MDIMNPPFGPINHVFSTVSNLGKLPQGKYLVTDHPVFGQGQKFGYVKILKNWFSVSHYTTEFEPFENGSGKWQGDLKIIYNYKCEGSYRYLSGDFSGTHLVFLLPNGSLKVRIFDEFGKKSYDAEIYWHNIK